MANPETHWVPLATVASFRRMKEITGKDRDLAWVAESVRRYASKDEVEVDEKGENIRRIKEVKETKPEEQMERSIYAVSLGDDSLVVR